MPFKNLEALPSLSIPDSRCFVRAAREKSVPLGVERNLQKRKNKKPSQVCVINIFYQQKGDIAKHLSPSQPGTSIYSYTEQSLRDGENSAGTNACI